MKILLLLSVLVSSAFAQDGYHQYQQTECANGESCLITKHVAIKLLPYENRKGEIIGERLSSDSSIADVVYPEAQLCYTGTIAEVCKMLDLMSGGQHDHGVVTSFYCKEAEGMIHTGYRFEYDWNHETHFISEIVRKCN